MRPSANIWALVLAAGEGRRLQSLTTDRFGAVVPKQFCSLNGGHSLLRAALRRCESVAVRDRICTVVDTQHRRWWQPMLEDVPKENVIIQPRNRGTGNGILLPLLQIMAKDPASHVVILPSDHYVREESTLANALQFAVRTTEINPRQIILLGMPPDQAHADLGYILPGAADAPQLFHVDRFVEKPAKSLAADLIAAGAMWNAFILTASARALGELFLRRYPFIVAEMHSAVVNRIEGTTDDCGMTQLYRDLPAIDFSTQVMQGAEESLRVLRVRPCGWNDLGTPMRLAETLRGLSPMSQAEDACPEVAALSLHAQHAMKASRLET
jgi:mannose-1-phosphate guanylyltransferase